MRISLMVSLLFVFVPALCVAQEPISVLDASWQRDRQSASKTGTDSQGKVRGVTDDNKYFQRKQREAQTNVTIDPNETTIDGRSATLDKIAKEAGSAKVEDVNGFSYRANIKNNTDKTVAIVFWEYRFTELSNPQNIVRRQFICSVNIKPDEKKELSVFSTLGPSDVISAESLSKTTEKLFDEKVILNRFEFSDGTLRQRGNWKYDDYQKSIERATATPWGKEVCRGF
ncbi:hypothetical protein BH10ACI2_BH10ACI2_12720 [soil metagenome]